MPGGAGVVGGAEDRQHYGPGSPLGLHPSAAPRPACPLSHATPWAAGGCPSLRFRFLCGLWIARCDYAVGPVRVPRPPFPSPGRADITGSTFCPGKAARSFPAGSGTPLTQGQNDLGVRWGSRCPEGGDALDRPLVRIFPEEVELLSLVS